MDQLLAVPPGQRCGPLARFGIGVIYGAKQLLRVAWFFGHHLVMRRLSKRARHMSRRPRPHTDAPTPSRRPQRADFDALVVVDLKGIEVARFTVSDVWKRQTDAVDTGKTYLHWV
jgi:hypothetical protein